MERGAKNVTFLSGLKIHRQIQKSCRENKISSDQPIFGNRVGKPLSRRNAAWRFAVILRKAQNGCPAIR
jgi:hypothetical protein